MKASAKAAPARAPWEALPTSGEVRVLEDEVAHLREALRRPPGPDDTVQRLEERRRECHARVRALEDERVALAARRDALRGEFDRASRAGRRRDGRLRAAGQVLGLASLLAALLHLAGSAPSLLSGGSGAQGVGLLGLAALGLALRARAR